MCTLIALHRCVPGAHLVIAANRDEYLDRPAEGPGVRDAAGVPVVAPLDRRAGGTWLGVSGAGLFAGVTNRPTPARNPELRSRGLVVLDALAVPTAAAAAGLAARLPANAYNPFNLFLADATEAFAVVYERGPRVMELRPGVHVVGNTDPDDRSAPKVDWLFERAEAAAGRSSDGTLEALAELCRTHVPSGDPLASPCIHAGHYGTRSSTLLRLGPEGAVLRHAEGPPCSVDYRDLSPLLDELVRAAEFGSGGEAARKAS